MKKLIQILILAFITELYSQGRIRPNKLECSRSHGHNDSMALAYLTSFDEGSNDMLTRCHSRKTDDISLWIDEQQVKQFSGNSLMKVFIILNGRVMPYVLDPMIANELPVIPHGMDQVNLTWRSRKRSYHYEFYNFVSKDNNLFFDPTLSINSKGTVPRRRKEFTIYIKCTGKSTGVAYFNIGVKIMNKKQKNLDGTPIVMTLQKECLASGFDEACDIKCLNGGICDWNSNCRCPAGYAGTHCEHILCYPHCRNGGTCSSPGFCICSPGFHGRFCQGGICPQKCLHGGKCIQKDTCRCNSGFYGKRCQFSKCIIPCVNGGRCKGINKCSCKRGFAGLHCEVIRKEKLRKMVRKCKKKCKHGKCIKNGKCKCMQGHLDRWCRNKKSTRRKSSTSKPQWI